jgi:thiamine pyrophosphokinase
MVMLVSCQNETTLKSDKSVFFVVIGKTQDNQDKQNEVAQYNVETWTMYYGSASSLGRHWITLEEKFEVGDTLKLTNK